MNESIKVPFRICIEVLQDGQYVGLGSNFISDDEAKKFVRDHMKSVPDDVLYIKGEMLIDADDGITLLFIKADGSPS